jgi:hypothetical protein
MPNMNGFNVGTILKIGAALLLGIGLVVAFPPASWLGDRIQKASTGRIRLVNAKGTAWQGTARVRIKQRGVRPIYIDNVNWRLSPLEVFKEERTLELNFAPYTGWGKVIMNKEGIIVSGLEFDMEPRELSKYMEVYSYNFEGKPHIRVEEMRMQRKDDDLTYNYLKAKMEWLGAAFTSPFDTRLETKNKSMFHLGDVTAEYSFDETKKISMLSMNNKNGDMGLKLRFNTFLIASKNLIEIELNDRSPETLRTFLKNNEKLTTKDGKTFTAASF